MSIALNPQQITLAQNLTQFPEELYDVADTLEILDLSNNKLRALPCDFHRFKKLRILFLSNNQFTTFPSILAACESLSMVGFKSNQITTIDDNAFPSQLRWLILTHNKLQTLPNSLGKLPKLQKLMLAGNQLRTLPDLSGCKNLELLRIAANSLPELPATIAELKQLAWLAYAGNPFCKRLHVQTNLLREFDWSVLRLHEELGSGASGRIWRARNHSMDNHLEEYAVKVFKGNITSDGYPEEEIHTWERVGTHPHMVTVRGRITNHPDNSKGLVFDLMPRSFTHLGSPPSYESCTRDTYAADVSFTPTQVTKIISQLNAVVSHLHERGVLHGDIYAHNILRNTSDDIVLSDFGAASPYDTNDRRWAQVLVDIERRACTHLRDELNMRIAR